MMGVVIDEEPKVATYQCLYGSALSIPGMAKNVFWESHGPGVATQFANLGGSSHFSLLKRLKKPISELHIFSNEEKKSFFEDIGDTSITSSLKARDLQKYCTWTHLAYQPEGSLKQWHHGRIVLCGESSAQMTSIAGMGFNTALQSAVLLANKLHKIMQSSPLPDTDRLTTAFEEYQEIRKIETRIASELSARYVRAVTWSSWIEWFFIEYLAPWVFGEQKMMKKLGIDVIAKGRKLDYIAYEDKYGTIAWEN
jgi:2-polyprenyl-6-methoxyphenol hydroxylase-like FAD-dependent oxidoreductase